MLEHLDDPVAALAAGRRLAAPQATLLVSVPNVGHLSIARDLLAGRFDPVPAGLCDTGHLRWFTRPFLEDALAESGWNGARVESDPGYPPPEPGAFLALASAWPDARRDSLLTYQWIATARAGRGSPTCSRRGSSSAATSHPEQARARAARPPLTVVSP